ncbi:glycerate kinase [uncultured Ferrimonas sp.]|uniref:glycerate kinase family protein n=1 Tax=uncultured Ferrimonas sp. TaxID=432640 RepID=UPI00262CFFAC|nr:glycerate kinase [uncultured Ferrimonas sp.]
MKIVVAPDSFKESLSALAVANHIRAGILQALPQAQVITLPAADGGEGTVQTLLDALGGEYRYVEVQNPIGQPIQAHFALLGDGDTAVIEMAEASGLHLLDPAQRDPRYTSTFGTGQLIRAALDCGVSRLLLGLGGSATNDGGVGMMQALGAQFTDRNHQPLAAGGAALAELAHIDLSQLDPRLAQIELQVACDVSNPLCGPQGASAVFGPQKGATTEMVTQLDSALQHYANIIEQQFAIAVANCAGAGAAGGMGAATLAFMSAQLRPGIELVLDAIKLDAHLAQADLLITGEGCLDGQSAHGKTPVGVAKRGQQAGVPVIAIAGSLGADAEQLHQHGIDAMFACVPAPMSFAQLKPQAGPLLQQTSRNVLALWALRPQN